MNFQQRVKQTQLQTKSLLCIGLDPDVEKIPRSLRNTRNPVLEFNKRVIGATGDLVCAYKLNLAFYEVYGRQGWEALEKSLDYIEDPVLRIADGKRNDIGNSAERYAAALLKEMDFDAVTVNPYMGGDTIEPFLRDPAKGAFVLTLTSNPGSKDFQKLRVGSDYLYEKVIRKAKIWNKNGNVGLVVGATHPRQLAGIRKSVPSMPILLPGVGAQGGDLRAAIRYGVAKDGDLLLINVGRSVLYAGGDDPAYERKIRYEALKLIEACDEIRVTMNK
jgi:orotidine 5'-phosphate decarboxylase subfamily 2